MARARADRAGGRARSSTCRGTRSPGSSATSASTRRSTSPTARWSSCKSTSSLFRGYSVFMKGKDPRDAALHHQPHLRHLRRQPRRLLGLRAEHGLRHQAAAAGRVDHQPRRGGRVHVRPHHLPGQPGVRRLLRADGQGDQPERAGQGGEDRGAARRASTATGRSPTSCASFNPFDGRPLPGGAADEPRSRGRCSA